jgi:acyl-coenzyme A synthetase/AMP-(fatty) acid ligase
MTPVCGCGFTDIQIFDDSTAFRCSDLVNLEIPAELWDNSNWKSYDESLRINPYVALHEAFRKNTSILFLPQAINSKYGPIILEALQKNSGLLPPGCLAFVTSGSTGNPKIIIHSKETLIRSASKIPERFSGIQGMRFHNVFPGNYMAGVLNNGILPWLIGSEVYLDSVFGFRSSFEIAKKSKRMNTNFAWLSPNMISTLNSAMGSDIGRKPAWEFALSATGPLSLKQATTFIDFGFDLKNTYGSTELLFISGTHEIKNEMTCGAPFKDVNIEIRKSQSLAEGGSGEVWVRTNTMPILELIHNPINDSYATFEVPEDDFRNTRDLGFIQQDQLFLVSRSDDVVVLGGVNFSLAALEIFADQFPGIVGSCAAAFYGGTFSDLRIYFETVRDMPFDQSSFQEYILKEFGVEQSPRKFIQMELPRTHNGKIDKKTIRNLA